MNTRTAFGLAMCLLAPAVTGCINYPCAVRGQSPAYDPSCPPGYGPAEMGGQMYPGHMGGQVHGGHMGGYGYAGDGGYAPRFQDRLGYYGQHLGNTLIPQHDHMGHYTTGGSHDYRGPGWYPTHHHFYTYRREDDLVYPPAQTPGAVVQYPYYTHRGPTDFFMQ